MSKTGRSFSLRSYAAITTARLIKIGLRLFGRGGTALPGKTALKIQPRMLSLLTEGRRVFLVTGTNGKTTTVRILCTLLGELGYTVITNPSGANLDSGLTTTLIDNFKVLKNSSPDTLALVLEIDEAYFAKLAGSLNPSVCVVTNFFP
jgi:UDP-N-acetylmuramyl tripeptide synthase